MHSVRPACREIEGFQVQSGSHCKRAMWITQAQSCVPRPLTGLAALPRVQAGGEPRLLASPCQRTRHLLGLKTLHHTLQSSR